MNTEDMIKELRNVEEKYKNKTYATGETNISLMCSEVADRLDLLRRENLQLSLSQHGMDKQVLEIVNEYIIEHLDKSDDIPDFEQNSGTQSPSSTKQGGVSTVTRRKV